MLLRKKVDSRIDEKKVNRPDETANAVLRNTVDAVNVIVSRNSTDAEQYSTRRSIQRRKSNSTTAPSETNR